MTVPAYVELQSIYEKPAGPKPSRVPGEPGPGHRMPAGKLGAHFRWHSEKPSPDCKYCTGEWPVATYTRHDGTVVPRVFEGTRHCCGGCDRELPLSIEYFRADNRRPSGLGYICRDCQSRKAREYRQAHPEKARERDRIKKARYWARRRAREAEAARKAVCPDCGRVIPLTRKQLQLVLAMMPDE